MATAVINISGIGPQTAKILEEHGLKTAEAIVKAGKVKLQAVPGFGPSRAKATVSAANALLSGNSSTAAGKASDKKNTTNKDNKNKKDKSKKDKAKKDKKSNKDKKKDKPKKKDKKDKKKKQKKGKK